MWYLEAEFFKQCFNLESKVLNLKSFIKVSLGILSGIKLRFFKNENFLVLSLEIAPIKKKKNTDSELGVFISFLFNFINIHLQASELIDKSNVMRLLVIRLRVVVVLINLISSRSLLVASTASTATSAS